MRGGVAPAESKTSFVIGQYGGEEPAISNEKKCLNLKYSPAGLELSGAQSDGFLSKFSELIRGIFWVNEARAEGVEESCEILPEETPTGTGYVKCCKEVNDACSGVDAADKTTEKPGNLQSYDSVTTDAGTCYYNIRCGYKDGSNEINRTVASKGSQKIVIYEKGVKPENWDPDTNWQAKCSRAGVVGYYENPTDFPYNTSDFWGITLPDGTTTGYTNNFSGNCSIYVKYVPESKCCAQGDYVYISPTRKYYVCKSSAGSDGDASMFVGVVVSAGTAWTNSFVLYKDDDCTHCDIEKNGYAWSEYYYYDSSSPNYNTMRSSVTSPIIGNHSLTARIPSRDQMNYANNNIVDINAKMVAGGGSALELFVNSPKVCGRTYNSSGGTYTTASQCSGSEYANGCYLMRSPDTNHKGVVGAIGATDWPAGSSEYNNAVSIFGGFPICKVNVRKIISIPNVY